MVQPLHDSLGSREGRAGALITGLSSGAPALAAGCLGIVALGSPAHAAGLTDCARTFDNGDVIEAVNSAEAAFTQTDAPAFKEAKVTVEARTACAAEILSPATQARIHRVEGLGAFLDGRSDRITQALGGMFAAEPGHQLPTKLLPDGHPIRGQVAPAMLYLRDDPGVELPPPSTGWIESDGAHVVRAPAQRAAVLQQLDGQGVVIATHYRWPDESGFDWIVPVEGALVVDVAGVKAPVTRTAAGPWAHRAPWLALSGASLITSGVLYALAADERSTFEAQPILGGSASDEERADYRAKLEGMQGGANGLSYGCYVAAGAGVAFGAVAAVTW